MNRSKVFLQYTAIVAVMVALYSAVGTSRRRCSLPPSSLASDDLPALLDHLRAAGFGLRAVPTAKGGPLADSAYLTETDKSWEELILIPATSETIVLWRGTLMVRQVPSDMIRESYREVWGDCCVVAGPFIFFGDAALLARLRSILGPLVTPDTV